MLKDFLSQRSAIHGDMHPEVATVYWKDEDMLSLDGKEDETQVKPEETCEISKTSLG